MPSSPSSPPSSSSPAPSSSGYTSSSDPISGEAAINVVRYLERLVKGAAPEAARVKPSTVRRIMRESDRLITPFTLGIFLLCLTEVIGVTLILAYRLSVRGADFQWIIDDATKLVTSAGTVLIAILTLAGRHQVSRVERKVTGTDGPASSATDSHGTPR